MASEPPVCEESTLNPGNTPFGDYEPVHNLSTPNDIPVYVPVGSAEKYRKAWGWDYFTNYYMNTEDGTFVFSNKTIPDNVSTDDHGYITTIQYAVDNQDNEDFEEVKKTVILRGANHYDCEEYVKQDGKWVGTYKDELILLPYPYFDVQYMSDPDAFVTKWESFIDFTNSIHIFYAWDKDNDKWVMDIGRVIEYAVNDNTLEFF